MRVNSLLHWVLVCFVASAPVFAQKTESDKAAEQQNREAGQTAAPGATLDVQPGAPTIKTKDIEQDKKITPWKRLPRYFLQDQKSIWTSPLHTSKADAKWWLIFGGATAGLIASDHWTSRQLPNTNTQLTVAKWTSKFGGSYFLLPVSGAFYFTGLGAGSERFRETGILGFEALADTEVVVFMAKLATHRARPLEGNSNGSFWSENGSLWNSSFPSGHAINSWALASIVAHEYPRPLIVPIASYGFATMVAGSRLAARQHFASDVVLGAAMGWFIGDFVYAKRHNRDLDKPSATERVAKHVHFGGPARVEMPPDAEAMKSAALPASSAVSQSVR